MSTTSVTVVVPTRDRPDALAACLEALRGQTLPVAVVVVDDGSADPERVASVVAATPRTQLLRLGGRGPAAARNAGIDRAGSEVVCLTDDDCRPEPGWAAELVAQLEAGASVTAGPTVVGDPADPGATAAQAVTNHLVHESHDPEAGAVGVAPTSNLAARRAVLTSLPFDEAYPAAAGEDRDWCDRLARAGGAIAWAPAAVVHHHPALPLWAFWRQQVRYGRGARRVHTTGAGRPAELGFYLRLARRGFAAGWRPGLLVVLAQLATATGYVAERRAARRQPR